MVKNIYWWCYRLVRYSNYKRYIRYWFQRRIRGWDDSDCWSLDHTIGKFVLPRLKRYKEITNGYPAIFNDIEDWHNILDKMIAGFELISNDEFYLLSNENEKIVEEALDLFRQYYRGLWD